MSVLIFIRWTVYKQISEPQNYWIRICRAPQECQEVVIVSVLAQAAITKHH